MRKFGEKFGEKFERKFEQKFGECLKSSNGVRRLSVR